MSKTIKCPKCDSYRYINHIKFDCDGGYSCWNEPCEKCNAKGYLEDPLTYWINAKEHPPENGDKIIGMDSRGMIHKMIIKDGGYCFDSEPPYAVSPIIYPVWYVPTPIFKEGDNNG